MGRVSGRSDSFEADFDAGITGLEQAMADPDDNIVLMRSVWRDEDFDDQGLLIAARAFPSEDLKSRYVSVDRHDLFDDVQAKRRLEDQQLRSIEKSNLSKVTPEVGFLLCSEVRNLKSPDNRQYLAVKDKSDGFYPSHCGIVNVNASPGKPSYNDMRRALMDILNQYGTVKMFPS